MAFESTIPGDSSKFPYNRGEDISGKSVGTLKNGANLGPSIGRPGNVLRITGVNAGVDLGDFEGRVIK